jgi:hypothetical protein
MLFFSRIVRIGALISALLLASFTALASAPDQITIRLIKVPANTPSSAPIYLSGAFNGWNAVEERYRLTPDQQGQYSITLPSSLFSFSKFRLTLGGEPDLAGVDDKAPDRTNRPYFVTESDTGTVYVAVLSWRNRAVEVSRAAPVPFVPKADKGPFADAGPPLLIGALALGCVIVIPAIIYVLNRRRRAQIFLAALDTAVLAECRAKSEELSEAIATIRADAKELERWSRAVGR